MTTREKIQILSTIPMPEPLINRLNDVSPDIQLAVLPANQAQDIPAERWANVEALITDQVLPDPSLTPKLRWVQFLRASLEHVQEHAIFRIRDIRLTTLSGANAPQAAEAALMSILALGHRVPQKLALQNKAQWDKKPWQEMQPKVLQNQTVGIVGYGSVGRELARLLQIFEVDILAAKFDAMRTQDEGFTLKGKGDPEGSLFKRLYPYQAVRSMVKDCDFVVLSVPLTEKTMHLVSKAEFEAMKPGTCLVNISHNHVVDEKALVEALEEEHLGGAVLAMDPNDPPPAESPLWNLKNLIIEPTMGWTGKQGLRKAAILITENFERYTTGTGLLNRYSHDKGY